MYLAIINPKVYKLCVLRDEVMSSQESSKDPITTSLYTLSGLMRKHEYVLLYRHFNANLMEIRLLFIMKSLE